jgi:hypothetical protein
VSSLRPCPGCSRHIQRIEDTCPFCFADVIEGLAVRARQKAARAPLKWTLVGLAGAAPVVATVLVSYGRGEAVPVYGAPPVPGSSFSVSSEQGPATPPTDAGAQPDAGAARDRKR